MAPPVRSRTVARNTLWMGLDTAFSFMSAAAISIAAARLLGPALLGPYNYTLWAAGLASYLVSLGVPAATSRFASELVGAGNVAQGLGVVRASLRFQAAFATVAVAATCGLVLALAPAQHRVYASIVILSLLPSALMGVFAAGINATEEALANVWPSITSTTVTLVGSLLALFYGRSLVGLTTAMLAGRVVDCVLRGIAFRRVYNRRWPGVGAEAPPAEVSLRLRQFSAGATLLSLLSAVVWDRSDIFFVNRFCTGREVAFFSVGANLAAQVLNVPQVFLNAAGMTMRVEQGRNPQGLGGFVSTTAYYVALLTLPLGWGLAALSPALVPVLYGAAYGPAIVPLFVAGTFVVAKAMLASARDVLLLRERYVALIGLGFATALVGVLLNLWLVPIAGAPGGALSNGLYHTMAALGSWMVLVRELHVDLPWNRLVRLPLAAGLMAGVVLVLARGLPGPIALAAGVPLGAVVYALALRTLHCLDASDAYRLAAFGRAVPPAFRGGFERLVGFVARS